MTVLSLPHPNPLNRITWGNNHKNNTKTMMDLLCMLNCYVYIHCVTGFSVPTNFENDFMLTCCYWVES